MKVLGPRAAYDRWAATYAEAGRNPLTDLAAELVHANLPPVAGGLIGDLGCGSGRWLQTLEREGGQPIGIDLSGPMLAAAAAEGCRQLLAADLRALPLASGTLDGALMVLSLSHVPAPAAALAEVARVLAPGAWVLVVDLHASAAARGWKRSFRGLDGAKLEVVWHPHGEQTLRQVAEAAGLRVTRWLTASLDAARLPTDAPAQATAGPALYAMLLRRKPTAASSSVSR